MKEFKIIEVKEITAKNGNKFLAYKTLDSKKHKMDVRFTRDCPNIPKETCVIVVPDDKCNVDTSCQYPVLWVKEVTEIKDFPKSNNVDEYFN